MDELKMLRDLAADEPRHDPAARAEVWSRLDTRQPRRWSQPRFLALGGAAVAVAVASVTLTLRSTEIGVTPAEAACPTSASAAQCARGLAAILLPSRQGKTSTGPPKIVVSLFTGFPGRADIYAMNSRGRVLRRLTKGRGDAAFPTWSPDGRRIAFSWTPRWSSQGAARGIYVMNADGSGRRLLARALWTTPAWSPDGSKIAFWTYGAQGSRAGIYVVERDGGGLHLIKRRGLFPSWSPDGRKIAYQEGSRIYVMNSDGTGRRLLGQGGDPAWSPDGKTIAFALGAQAGNHTFPVWAMNADGLDKRPLHVRTWVDCELKWSPDGRLAVSNPAGLFLVRPRGHEVTKISSRNICGIAWQPVSRPAGG